MGELLPSPIKEKDLSDNENSVVRYGCCGMQGWRRRMEDAHITDISQGENGRFEIFGVFDGHGGKEVSNFAKNHFTKAFISNPRIKKGQIKQAIIETYLKIDELMRESEGKEELKQIFIQSKYEDEIINQKLIAYNSNNKMLNAQIELNKNALLLKEKDIASFTGCTACVCIIDNVSKKIYFANAGDSRVVLCKNGTAYRMSIDHKPELELEKNRIMKANGWINEGRINGNLNLSRGFGDLEYKSNRQLPPQEQIITAYPDVIEESLEGNEFIIIGCDGIWDCLQDYSIYELIKKEVYKPGIDPKKVKLSNILAQIVDNICPNDIYSEKGVGSDNMTCILVQFK